MILHRGKVGHRRLHGPCQVTPGRALLAFRAPRRPHGRSRLSRRSGSAQMLVRRPRLGAVGASVVPMPEVEGGVSVRGRDRRIGPHAMGVPQRGRLA